MVKRKFQKLIEEEKQAKDDSTDAESLDERSDEASENYSDEENQDINTDEDLNMGSDDEDSEDEMNPDSDDEIDEESEDEMNPDSDDAEETNGVGQNQEENEDLSDSEPDIDEEIKIDSNPAIKLLAKLEKTSSESKKKPGVIYLSRIPSGMKIEILRSYMGNIGPVGRVFLRAAKPSGKKRRKLNKFLEGWVEFKKKKHARDAADFLNNKPVGGKKKFVGHDELWNIQYLPRFKWEYLGYQKEHDMEDYKHRMSENIKKVLKETDEYTKAADEAMLDKLVAQKVEERQKKREEKKAYNSLFESVFA